MSPLRLLKKTQLPSLVVMRMLCEAAPVFSAITPEDMIVASYPKSGSTMFHFVWSNLERHFEGLEAPVTFQNISTDYTNAYPKISKFRKNWKHIPRPIKTHLPRKFIPITTSKIIHISRHPADVMISYFHYEKKKKNSKFSAKTLSEFIRDDDCGVNSWIRFTKSWQKTNTLQVSYDDLRFKPVECLEALVDVLDIDKIMRDQLENIARISSFENVRKLEGMFGHREERAQIFEGNARFARSGASGQYLDEMTNVDQDFIREQISRAGLEKYWSAVPSIFD